MSRLSSYYLTSTGTNPRQLQIRLSWLVREFTHYTSVRMGRAALLDLRSERARWAADGLIDAIRLLLAQDEADSPPALVAAVRKAEERWRTVCLELSRGEAARADLRTDGLEFVSRPARRRTLPAQRTRARGHTGALVSRAAQARNDDRQFTRQG